MVCSNTERDRDRERITRCDFLSFVIVISLFVNGSQEILGISLKRKSLFIDNNGKNGKMFIVTTDIYSQWRIEENLFWPNRIVFHRLSSI